MLTKLKQTQILEYTTMTLTIILPIHTCISRGIMKPIQTTKIKHTQPKTRMSAPNSSQSYKNNSKAYNNNSSGLRNSKSNNHKHISNNRSCFSIACKNYQSHKGKTKEDEMMKNKGTLILTESKTITQTTRHSSMMLSGSSVFCVVILSYILVIFRTN